MAIKKIKSFEDTFKTSNFLEEAIDIYKNAHDALAAWVKNENYMIFFTVYTFTKY